MGALSPLFIHCKCVSFTLLQHGVKWVQARCLHLHNTTESHGASRGQQPFYFPVSKCEAHLRTKKGLNGFSKPPKQNKIYAHPLFPRLIKKIKVFIISLPALLKQNDFPARRAKIVQVWDMISLFKNSCLPSPVCARQICFAELQHSLCRVFRGVMVRHLGCSLAKPLHEHRKKGKN